jgi:hypothetical protein
MDDKHISIISVFNNTDILDIIINYLRESKEVSFLSLIGYKEINKSFYSSVNNIFKHKYKEEELISGRATFICVAYCWFCNTTNNLRTLTYPYDTPPQRIISTCSSFSCRLKTYQSFLYDSYAIEKKIIMYKDLNLPKMYIPRSDGSKTLAVPTQRYLMEIENKLFLNFTFNDLQKNCDFKEVIELNKDNEVLQQFLFNLKNKGLNYSTYYDIAMRNKFNSLVDNLCKNI